MENRKGLLTHFGGIIRIIILIVSVAVITFFVVRFFRNRAATRTAEQSAQVSQTDKQKDSSNEKKTEANDSGAGSSATNDSNEATIPSGVAEGSDSDETSTMPAVGMGLNMLGVAFALSAVTYGVVFLKTKQRIEVSV